MTVIFSFVTNLPELIMTQIDLTANYRKIIVSSVRRFSNEAVEYTMTSVGKMCHSFCDFVGDVGHDSHLNEQMKNAH